MCIYFVSTKQLALFIIKMILNTFSYVKAGIYHIKFDIISDHCTKMRISKGSVTCSFNKKKRITLNDIWPIKQKLIDQINLVWHFFLNKIDCFPLRCNGCSKIFYQCVLSIAYDRLDPEMSVASLYTFTAIVHKPPLLYTSHRKQFVMSKKIMQYCI